MEEIKQEIQKHIEAAYALLPSKIEPAYAYRKRDDLKEAYERKDWRQLFAHLQSHSRVNHFSDELLLHVKTAEELYSVYDRLGLRAALEQLTEEEKRVIGECLNATAQGPFFLDNSREFVALFGATHEEAVRIAETWPNIEETDMTAKAVINNSINNLFGYPHGKHDQWSRYISVSPRKVQDVFTKFRVLAGMSNGDKKAGSSRHFDQMM
jgi:hypothetical protein